MCFKSSGTSTPFFEDNWKNKEKGKTEKLQFIKPDQKVKVFISSICGIEKYDKVREELKRLIESTELADVYTFESKEASTLSAGNHYSFALEDSDVCIFLIDNADGITSGVQKEIDIVKNKNIKAIYYFCDENSKEKTAVEEGLMGANFAKCKTIHKFSSLSENGAQGLINDITEIYHHYCKGRLLLPQEDESEEIFQFDISNLQKQQLITTPKSVLKNVDKCTKYILKLLSINSRRKYPNDIKKTSSVDEWGVEFLPVLFEGKSIKNFNLSMYLETLKELQDEDYHKIVILRWNAIQSYFIGDIEECINLLNQALELAREKNQPTWMIKDILIDIRNQSIIFDEINSSFSVSKAQEELTNSTETLYYPDLDRINNSINEKYIEGLFKKKIESPYTVTLDNDISEYGELLASSYIISMYNGSLTHLLLLYKRLKYFLFYLNNKHNDWDLKREMLKLSIFGGETKEINGILNSYPEILKNLKAEEAEQFMVFCNNHPIEYKRIISQLLAFGIAGYYLKDDVFKRYENIILSEIIGWANSKKPNIYVGQTIFNCLSNIAYRISQDKLSEICCVFIDKKYGRWYKDMFRFISNYIDISKMKSENTESLISHIEGLFEDRVGLEQIKYAPSFLTKLRIQDKNITNEIDNRIERYMPEYYKNDYMLYTSEDDYDFTPFIKKYIEQIQEDNKTQGKSGHYVAYGIRKIARLRWILIYKKFQYSNELMQSIILTISDTLMISNESIETKLDAVSLLNFIILKCPYDYECNKDIFEKIYEGKDNIENMEYPPFLSNINIISLKIGLQLLFTFMGKETYSNILELMPYTHDDIETTIAVTRIIVEALELNTKISIPEKTESVILQNVLQWLYSDNLSIRYNATIILLNLLSNKDNISMINRKILSLIDNDNMYIKKLILERLRETEGLFESTKKYIIQKCENDENFFVREVCKLENKTI